MKIQKITGSCKLDLETMEYMDDSAVDCYGGGGGKGGGSSAPAPQIVSAPVAPPATLEDLAEEDSMETKKKATKRKEDMGITATSSTTGLSKDTEEKTGLKV